MNPCAPPFAVRVEIGPLRVLVEVSGELDLATAGELARRLDELRRAGWATVEVDLSDVSFMDLTGLRALLEAHDQYRDAGAELSISGESPAVRRLLGICGAMPEDLRARERLRGARRPCGSPRVGPVHRSGHDGSK